jgi:hypothetical protein
MACFRRGQRVRIVKGSYKKNVTGTCIEACGKVSCRVKVDHDIASKRTIRLSSIEPFFPNGETFQNGNDIMDNGRSPYKSDWATRSKMRQEEDVERKQRKAGAEKALEKLENMRAMMDEMEKQIRNIINDNN